VSIFFFLKFHHLNKYSAGSGTLGLRGSSTGGTASRLVKRRNTNLTIHINTNIFMIYLLHADAIKNPVRLMHDRAVHMNALPLTLAFLIVV
jgi:hypothetical protein